MLLFIGVVGVLALVAAAVMQGEDKCPSCHRELDPEDYSGWVPGMRRFCQWCKWREDDAKN